LLCPSRKELYFCFDTAWLGIVAMLLVIGYGDRARKKVKKILMK
jgi:hypothetical protein